MYSQQYTLCYCLVKSLLRTCAFKICWRHQSVTLFLSGAPPPKKNPWSAPAIFTLYTKSYPVYYNHLFDIWLSTLEIGAAQQQQQQQNFINKLIIWQKHCSQLASGTAGEAIRGGAGQCVQNMKVRLTLKTCVTENAQKSLFLRVNRSPTDPVWLSCRRKSYPV